MAKQRTWLIGRGASFIEPDEECRVDRYVRPEPEDCPSARQRRRLSDKLRDLVEHARDRGDVAAAEQLRHILEGMQHRGAGRAGPDRRDLHPHP